MATPNIAAEMVDATISAQAHIEAVQCGTGMGRVLREPGKNGQKTSGCLHRSVMPAGRC